MSTIEDLSKLVEHNYPDEQVKHTLLYKYQIPVNHFEFDYVEKCKDGKELEKILLVLRSGEEGYFPDLEKSTEKRLREIKPKSKLLRSVTQVLNKSDLERSDLETILRDLNIWVDKISKDDEGLETRKSNRILADVEIRHTTEHGEAAPNKKEKHIGATDFQAWNKYDPDTEILKMELQEEKEKQEVFKKENKKKAFGKTVTFNEYHTEVEAKFLADREKEKGNEFFKNSEHQDALYCYTNSIALKANIDNLNNRSVTYLKLKKYDESIADCRRVLNMDKDNTKANLRIAEALERTNKFEEASKHIEIIIRKDPNNQQAQILAEKIGKNCNKDLKGIQMQITETV